MKNKLLLLLFVTLPIFVPITSSYAPPHPRDVYPEDDYYDDYRYSRSNKPMTKEDWLFGIAVLGAIFLVFGYIPYKFGFDIFSRVLVGIGWLLFLYLGGCQWLDDIM